VGRKVKLNRVRRRAHDGDRLDLVVEAEVESHAVAAQRNRVERHQEIQLGANDLRGDRHLVMPKA
jgi:hypothetical protein